MCLHSQAEGKNFSLFPEFGPGNSLHRIYGKNCVVVLFFSYIHNVHILNSGINICNITDHLASQVQFSAGIVNHIYGVYLCVVPNSSFSDSMQA